MKDLKKIIWLLFLVAGSAFVLQSCEKDDANTGTPTISYVRVTNPESGDSLLVSAGQGQLIAIVGDHLQNAVEVWFNDQQSRLTPTYISKNTILVVVPSQIPKEITNQLRILFSNGYELLHNFKVDISKPLLSSLESEYVNTGDVAVLHGNYFYAPLTVTFTGGAQGEIVSVEDQEIKFTVPAEAQPGPITVTTNFGTSKSNFFFRDNRNMFITSDPYEGWWNSSLVVSNPGPNDPPLINGNYFRMIREVGSWSWFELAGGPATAMPSHSKNIPDAAILTPENYNLKFEVATMKPYNGNMLKFNVGLSSEDNGGYQWKPPFDTQGKWQTVTIPLEEVFAGYATRPTVNPNGYWSRILVGNAPGAWDADIAFDNFRVVPKVVQ